MVASLTLSMTTRGHICLFLSLLFIVVNMGTIFVCKMLPPSSVWWVSAVQRDEFYCLLVPLLLPVGVTLAWINWLGMKLYRHN